jgi:hypothetical protein
MKGAMLSRGKLVFFILILSLSLLAACAAPAEAPEPITAPPSEPAPAHEDVPEAIPAEPLPEPVSKAATLAPGAGTETEPLPAEPADEFAVWWEDFKKTFNLDSSSYPEFWRGVWGSRLDELRSYLLNAEKLRGAGVDSVMLGVDIVFDPDTGAAKSLGDDVFLFYLQALRKEGFRVIIMPNPMHPNLDMGLGYEWEGHDPGAGYHRSYELIHRLDDVVLKWVALAEEYGAEGFAPCNEPYKLVREYEDASRWLQEIRPRIREAYHGPIWAVDTMHDTGPGRSIPYSYDYSGYDYVLGGPPAGWQELEAWEEMLEGYVRAGDGYVGDYELEGFGLYECGAYTGGIWYEDGLGAFDQILGLEQAGRITEAMVRQAEGNVGACFPRVAAGWIDFGTPAFEILASWYRGIGDSIAPPESGLWTYEQLVGIEQELGGDDYEHIFQVYEITDTARQ